MRSAAVLIIFTLFSFPSYAQTSDPDVVSRIKQYSAEENWQEVVRIAEADAAPSADVLYFHGFALARLNRWLEAEIVFERGRAEHPRDKRFPIELAGITFRQKNYKQAADYLHKALRLDQDDRYANDFLGSVYFLQGNQEAALKYWNRVSKPGIEQVHLTSHLKVDKVLLDNAFEFAPASVLQISEFRTTEARVGGLGIFPDRRFDLEARPDGRFDVVFRASERNGFGAGKWQGLVSLLRGLPFQTVHPEYYNIGGRAINAVTLYRWDAQKRRVRANLSGPLTGDPRWRHYLELDLRDENWDIQDLSGERAIRGGLKLRKQAFSAGVTSIESGRWSWSTGFELSNRKFLDVTPGPGLTPKLLAEGLQLKHSGQVDYSLARIPERRLTVKSGVSTQLGRVWSEPSNTFAKFQGSLETHWLPQASGDDYEMNGKIRAGWTIGDVPFDELFSLGIERDSDLWLRAHTGTKNGRKGSAPMGRSYFLSSLEIDKNVFSRSLINVKLGPFLDIGRIKDFAGRNGSQKWLWDLGVQAKVGVLGQGILFSYGRDLQTGNDVFFITVQKHFQ